MGTKIIDGFSEQLRSRVLEDRGTRQGGTASEAGGEQAPVQANSQGFLSTVVQPVEAALRDGDALDLMDFAGPAAAKRALSVVAALAAAA